MHTGRCARVPESHLGNDGVCYIAVGAATAIADTSPPATYEELHSPEVHRVTCCGWCAPRGDGDQSDITLRRGAWIIRLAPCGSSLYCSGEPD